VGRAHPAVAVADPAQHADRRVGEVEAAVQRLRERGRVGLDELEPGVAAVRELARLGQRGRGEVDAGDARAAARERDRVVRDVALDVDDVEARDVADRLAQRRVLLAAQGRSAGDQPRAVVVGVLAMGGGERVPVAAVGVDRVGQV
jgi:hypothetical protein